jgi:hypothetical protein
VQFTNTVDEVGSNLRNSLTELVDSAAFDFVEAIFADNQPGLEIVPAIDENQRFPIIEIPKRALRVVGLTTDAEPEHIDGNSVFLYLILVPPFGRPGVRRSAGRRRPPPVSPECAE